MQISRLFSVTLLMASFSLAAFAGDADLKVKITPTLGSVEVMHEGKKVTVKRAQDEEHQIDEVYTKTSRPCPPFCVQPMQVAPGVKTVGELEVLDSLKKISNGDDSIMLVDSRTPEWLARGTIPGAVNIPWTRINLEQAPAFDTEVAETFEEVMTKDFGAKKLENDQWDFSGAKTLVLFCNGIWCHQSSINIETLLEYGYPADKLQWYRGGMQDWISLGLTTAKPGK